MKRKEFKNCFELISPTDVQKQRMLKNIMTSKTQTVKKINFAKAASVLVPIAAAAAVLAFGVNTFYEKDSMPNVLEVQTADKQETAKNEVAGVFEQTEEKEKTAEKIAANDSYANSVVGNAKNRQEGRILEKSTAYSAESATSENDGTAMEKATEAALDYSLNMPAQDDGSNAAAGGFSVAVESLAEESAGDALAAKSLPAEPVSFGAKTISAEDEQSDNEDDEFTDFVMKCDIMRMKAMLAISPVQLQRDKE